MDSILLGLQEVMHWQVILALLLGAVAGILVGAIPGMEPAGAMAIADLVTSPLADGLFRRAIIQSGHGSMVRPIPIAQRLVRKLAKILRIAPDAAGYRSVGIEPGLTLLLDLGVAHGRERTRGRDLLGGTGPDRIERERDEFFERVRDGFLRRAAEHPQRFRVLDASPSADRVASAALDALAAYRKDLP